MYFDNDDDIRYGVVCNDEEQYSLWPLEKDLPAGWVYTGFEGTRPECVAHIDTVWVDMRPASLRRHMESVAADDREVGR